LIKIRSAAVEALQTDRRTDRHDAANRPIFFFLLLLVANTPRKGLLKQGVSETSLLGSQVEPHVIYLTDTKVTSNHIVHVLYCIVHLHVAVLGLLIHALSTQYRNISYVTSPVI
jgi:hypothetical protein